VGTMYQHFTNKIVLSAAIGIFSLTAVIASTVYAATDQEFAADCHKKIADLEQQAAASGNPEFYKQAADVGFSCLKEGSADSRDSMLFPLGVDELHETSNYVKYCRETIAQKEKTTASAQDPMVQFSLLKELLAFTMECHKRFTSELFNPSLVPRLGSDDLHETSNLVNNCQAIMDKLKKQYDPLHCELSDVARRNEVIKNMHEVAVSCYKSMTSELIDPSMVPRLDFKNPYGVGDFCSHRVCGLLPPICEPEENQPSTPDSKPVEMPTSETDSSTKAIPVTTITETPPITPVAKVGTSCREEWDHCLQSARNVQEACNKDAYENWWSCKDACVIGSEGESECRITCYQTYHKTEIDCVTANENSYSACMREYYRCRKTCGSIDFLDLSECSDQKPAEPPKCVSITYETARTEKETQRAQKEMASCNRACSNKYIVGPNNCRSECLFAQSIDELICNDKASQCHRTCDDTFRKCYEYGCDTDKERLDACTKRCESEQAACNQPIEPTFEQCQKNCTEADSQCMEGCRTPCHAAEGDAVQRPVTSDFLSLPEEITVGGTSYAPALVDIAPTKDTLKKIISVTESGPVFGPFSRKISSGRRSDTPIIEEGPMSSVDFDVPARSAPPNSVIPPRPIDFKIDLNNLAETEPTFTFNSGAGEFSLDIGALLHGAKAADPNAGLEVDTSVFLGKKIPETLEQRQSEPVKSVTITVPEIQTKPLIVAMPLAETAETLSSSGYDIASLAIYPGSAVVLDLVVLDSTVVSNSTSDIWDDVRMPAASNVAQDAKAGDTSLPKVVAEVGAGKAIYVAGWTAADTLSVSSDFVAAFDDVGVRHKKTAYGVAIDPRSGKKIIEIYDGEIDVFDTKTGAVLATLSTTFGAEIKRVEIGRDGAIKRQIAIPKSEWPAFVAKHQKSRSGRSGGSGAGRGFFLFAIFGAAAYFAYRKRDTILNMVKKLPMQK